MTEVLDHGRIQPEAPREVGSTGAGTVSALLARSLAAATGGFPATPRIETAFAEGDRPPIGWASTTLAPCVPGESL